MAWQNDNTNRQIDTMDGLHEHETTLRTKLSAAPKTSTIHISTPRNMCGCVLLYFYVRFIFFHLSCVCLCVCILRPKTIFYIMNWNRLVHIERRMVWERERINSQRAHWFVCLLPRFNRLIHFVLSLSPSLLFPPKKHRISKHCPYTDKSLNWMYAVSCCAFNILNASFVSVCSAQKVLRRCV